MHCSVVVAPGLYIASDDVVDRMLSYAVGGGHLVLTFRSGYADADGKACATRVSWAVSGGDRGELPRVLEPDR